MHFSLKHKDNIVIIVVWSIIYASTPLYMYFTSFSNQQEFDWHSIWSMWSYTSAFLLLFLLNHYILIPKLINKKHIVAYIVSIILGLCVFTCFLFFNKSFLRPHPKFLDREHKFDSKNIHGPIMHEFGPMPHNNQNNGHKFDNRNMHRPHMHEFEPIRHPIFPNKDHQFDEGRIHGPWMRPFEDLPLAPPDMMRIIIAILMLGVDLGAAAWLNEQKMRQRLLLLEQQNLKQELEHLRYQINPHLFMNTLNNIHALVDIDKERAKRAIIELSRLMRYALYGGNSSMVSLSHEVEFLRLYVSLMKLRFNDKVEIICKLPENAPAEVMLPPLLLATFVENAFKHGISYRTDSFIHIHLSLEDDNKKICFRCINSLHKNVNVTEDGYHGIGFENVRKRLDLQYADNYTLVINDKDENTFTIELVLPNNQKTT